MRSFTNLFVALVGASVVTAVTSISDIQIKQTLPSLTGKVIVELASGDSTSSFAKRDVHAALFDRLDRRGVKWETNAKYDSPLFTGVSLTLTNPEDLAALNDMEGVKAVHPVKIYDAPRVMNQHIITGKDDANLPAGDLSSTHIMTGVDKLHAKGIKGKGVKIGIIDTGVDYTHPYLGKGFGKGHLVVGGYDFVGDKFDSNTNPVPVPDADPLDQCAGHGTHVAGIIAMQPGNMFNLTGVSYQSSLYAYRIFGCTGSTDDDVIIQALLRAYKDGCDVITLSLGGPDGWTTSAGSVVASRIADKGKVVTIAAGNEGAEGGWYTSSPGNGLDVISVASVDNTEVFYNSLDVSGVSHDPIAYLTDGSIKPLDVNGSWPLYALTTDTTVADDACNALPASTPDLSKYAVLIRRGTCNFTVKIANAAAKGAKLVVVYNNGGSFSPVVLGNDTAAVLIDTADGEFLVQQYAAKAAVTISFPAEGMVQLPSTTGGLTSDYSTFGPTNDMFFKPAVAAPGGNIMSTYPVPLGSWAVLSGTSMATPHTAGVAALLLQSKGKTSAVAKNMRTLLQTTSTVIASDNVDGAAPQTLSQAGAGLVNAYNALTFSTTLSTGEWRLNDTANWKTEHIVTIKNNGKKKVSYKLSHVPAGTAVSINSTYGIPNLYPVTQTSDKVGVKLSKTSFTLAPGKSTTIKAWFTAPKLNAASYPVLSGHIQVQGGGEILKVSYLGVAASLKNAQVIDGSPYFFGTRTPLLLDASGNVQTPENSTYALSNTSAPAILFRMAWGTPLLSVDLVSKDLHTHVTLNPPTSFTNPKLASGTKFSDVKVVGNIGTIPYMSRDSTDQTTGYETIALPTTFANGTAIAPGQYRLLLRAQHIASDPKLEASYDVFMSDSFTIESNTGA